ncbi:MAG: hypothetical protein JO112_07725 [Planctomycetes bacterium]|nr:hypothetical protein [Planctomycetota bacterium]
MRALAGAIITAAALIGLGLTAIGFGNRYGNVLTRNAELQGSETALIFIMIYCAVVGVIGLGLAFLGLAYHHHRRHHEFLKEHGGLGTHHLPTMGTTTTPAPPVT